MHTLSKRTTINDIARELGLTSASVSRALNDHPRISVDTKKSVQAKALEMNYRQNKLASSLRSGKSHTIGVIIPSAQINFFGSVVHGIQNMASVNGYTIILYQSEENQALEQKAIETFLDARVDGILVSISKETTDYSHFVELKKKKIPLVFFDRNNESLKIPSVVIDDFKGAYRATAHLIEMGYRNIMHVTGAPHLKAFKDRLNGYKAAMADYKMPYSEASIYNGNISIESGKEAVDYFLSLETKPDAIFAVEDFSALGVMQRLKELKIIIPKEFGVIGFANESFGEYISPSLSTVDQQTVEMGKKSFELLLEIIENGVDDTSEENIILEPVLYFRESSRRVKLNQMAKY